MAVLVLLWTCGGVTAQSSADQAFKNIPQTTKQNAENKAVTKSNTVSNNAMDKVDSASNKVFKSFTGLFKKKNKAKKTDSVAPRPPDTTQGPKSSLITQPPMKQTDNPSLAICYASFYLDRPRTIRAQNKFFS